MKKLSFLAIVLLACVVGCTSTGRRAATAGPRQTPQTLADVGAAGQPLHYLLYLPPDYARSRARWPLVLFLHGAGERGANLERLKVHGPPRLVAQGKDFPFILVSPQCPAGRRWQSAPLIKLLDHIQAQYRVDPDRVYVTGLSMGGYGTWLLASEHPERFAAAAPICGRASPEGAPRLKHLPLWVFHGARDNLVPITYSEQMVEALRALGADVRFTVYPEAGHDSWTETYDNPEFWDWLLAQRRRPR
ncbi:prolyl oligopeptidase family serine peptidase [bacterium]|nr:prolyl oligopeptidase family serine peptidase [bacterium]